MSTLCETALALPVFDVDIAEIALMFGANDVGGVLMDEMVVRAAGIDNRATSANMRKVIQNAGLVARERDGLYNTIKIF